MRERNMTIFKILLGISSAILLGQTVLQIVLLPEDTPGRYSIPIVTLLATALTAALVSFATLNPQYGHNYSLHIRDGRVQWRRIRYGADPDGMRYILSGIATLFVAVIFAAIAAGRLWSDKVDKTILAAVCLTLAASLLLPYHLIEKRLRR